MKKRISVLFSLTLCIGLLVLSIVPFQALTLTNSNGYHYTTETENGLAALYSVDEEITDVVIPQYLDNNMVYYVYDYAFYKNKSIQSLNMSNATNLRVIGEMAFANTNITNVTIPYWVSIMKFAAFQDCKNLESITINALVTTIPSQLCNRCESLTTAIISSNVESIEKYAFANCSNLFYMEIGKNVTSIAKSAFSNDPNLTLGVWYDSYGYHYAVENNIPYTLLDGVKLGDTDGDGYVNINDVTAIQRHLAQLETLEGIYLHAADANQDGTVEISDATIIQMYLAEYEMEYPIGEVMTQ